MFWQWIHNYNRHIPVSFTKALEWSSTTCQVKSINQWICGCVEYRNCLIAPSQTHLNTQKYKINHVNSEAVEMKWPLLITILTKRLRFISIMRYRSWIHRPCDIVLNAHHHPPSALLDHLHLISKCCTISRYIIYRLARWATMWTLKETGRYFLRFDKCCFCQTEKPSLLFQAVNNIN